MDGLYYETDGKLEKLKEDKMSQIADLIYEQMARAGQPRTVTQTGTVEQKSPLDLGSLGMLLYMMLSQGKNKESIGTTPAPAGLDMSRISGLAPGAMQSASYQNPIDLILKLFGGMGGIGGAGGLR